MLPTIDIPLISNPSVERTESTNQTKKLIGGRDLIIEVNNRGYLVRNDDSSCYLLFKGIQIFRHALWT